MNYTKNVLLLIDCINNILNDIKVSGLFENSDIKVDQLSSDSWLKFDIKKRNSISISLIINNDGVIIGLDRVSEALDWSKNDIINSKDNFAKIIRNLFTCYGNIIYHGKNSTVIKLFNPNTGKITNIFKYNWGIGLFNRSQEKLVFPVFKYN